MLWRLETFGTLLAVAQNLFILCMEPVNSSCASCQRCPKDPLSKIRAQTRLMERQARDLSNSYVIHQGLHRNHINTLCHEVVPGFPKGTIVTQPEMDMLQQLYRTMVYMNQSFQVIREHQQDLNEPDAVLLQELRHAHLAVRGLLSNIVCAFCVQGASPSPVTIPERPTVTKAFQQKIEGCKVLWNYARFMERLTKSLRENRKQVRRTKMGRRQGKKKKASPGC
ncbi:PREDICTED: leukemia inhibitory factor-like isoform X1 [Crocodylus porosus]|nr:PREDICTED: leukemia inhibitory factor-like isoform X1 [Crocodylus porosus]